MVIGVTGKTGAGKNVAASHLEKLGFKHYDLDLIAHKIINEQRDKIVQCFGSSICGSNYHLIDRSKLGKIVFSNPAKLKVLEGIIHPKIDEYVFKEMGKDLNSERDVVINAALLYKSKLHYECETILFIDASPIRRFFRLLKRDDRGVLNIIKRMRNQSDIKSSNYISVIKLNNNFDTKQMLKYVSNLVETKNKYDKFIKEVRKV